MIDVAEMFRSKELDEDRLLAYGFDPADGGGFSHAFRILDGEYTAIVHFSDNGEPSFRVFDGDDEEYLPANVHNAKGSFVGEVHLALERILKEIADECFYVEHFAQDQTRRMLAFVEKRYGVVPEFLWKTFPDFAALRVAGKKSWFAVVGRIGKDKFGIDEDGIAEVINLKDDPVAVRERIASGAAYPAYHMNKQHWYSLLLDHRLSDDEVIALIEKSYAIVDA